jgi:hypothetical protein
VERLARKVRAVAPWLEASDFPAVRARSEMEYLSNQVCAALAWLELALRIAWCWCDAESISKMEIPVQD